MTWRMHSSKEITRMTTPSPTNLAHPRKHSFMNSFKVPLLLSLSLSLPLPLSPSLSPSPSLYLSLSLSLFLSLFLSFSPSLPLLPFIYDGYSEEIIYEI